MFDLTLQFADIAPPDDDTAALFAAVAADREASDDLMSVLAGTMAPEAFFDPANLARLLSTAA